jgi:hypothetical protein
VGELPLKPGSSRYNVGSTDAKNVVSWWTLSVRPRTVDSGGHVSIYCSIPPKPFPQIVASVLQPRNPLIEQAQRLSIEDAQKASGASSTEVIEMVGHIEYNDIFPNTPLHHFDWCIVADPHDVTKNEFSFFIIKEKIE